MVKIHRIFSFISLLSMSAAALAGNTLAASSDYKKLSLQQAELKVVSVAIAPVKNNKVQFNANLRLSIQIKNIGSRATGNSASYSLGCKIIKGTKCPAPTTKGKIPYIPAGQTRSIILVSASKAQPGKYLLSVGVSPTGRGRPYTREIEVAGLRLFPKKKRDLRKFSIKQRRIIRIKPAGKTKWVHVACKQLGPVEFPRPRFTNTDTMTMPVFSEILYMVGGSSTIRIMKLKKALAVGQSVDGPNFEAGSSNKCVAVGRVKI